MGHFNEILAGRFNRFTQKHFSMKGRDGTPTLAADVQMGMAFHAGEENRYLESWDMFGIGRSVSAFAAQFQTAQLRNPAGSNVCAVITQFSCSPVLAAGLQMICLLLRGNTVDQPTLQTSIPLDVRTKRNGSCVYSDNAGAAPNATTGTTINVGVANVGANTTYLFVPTGLEFPLLPGDTLALQNGVVNNAYAVQVWWRERPLEDSEKF